MEGLDGTALYLTSQHIITHNEEAKQQQKCLLSLLSKRADIEHDYLTSLSDWQEEFDSSINGEGFLYKGDVKEAYSLLSKEAEAASNIHYHLFNKIYMEACVALKSGSSSVDSCISQPVPNYDKLLQDFDSIQKKRFEITKSLNKANECKSNVIDAVKDIEEQVQGQKRYGSLPTTPEKLKELKDKQNRLQKKIDSHNKDIAKAQKKIKDFDMSNAEKLNTLVKEFEQVARSQLQSSLESIQKVLQTFREQEDMIIRKDKQKLLFKSDQILTRSRIEIMKRDCLDKMKSKINSQIVSTNAFLKEVQPMKQNNVLYGDGENYHSLPTTNIKGLPDGLHPPVEVTLRTPVPKIKETTSIPIDIGHHQPPKSKVKSTKSTPSSVGKSSKSKATSKEPEKIMDSVEAFYVSSDDSLTERRPIIEKEIVRVFKRPTELPPAPPTSKASKQSNISIESIEWIEEQKAPYTEERKRRVRDFCISEGESSEESLIVPTRRGVKKICDDTSTSENEFELIEEKEEKTKPRDILFDNFANVQAVTQLRNTRVMARYDYTARKAGELDFKQGQIIKQKLGKDEYGFSYGWTRSNKFHHKQYGYYPSELVIAIPIDDHRLSF